MPLHSQHGNPGSLTPLHARRKHRYKRQENTSSASLQSSPTEAARGSSTSSREPETTPLLTPSSSIPAETRSQGSTSNSLTRPSETTRPTYDTAQSSLFTSYSQPVATFIPSTEAQTPTTTSFTPAVVSFQGSIPTTQIQSQPPPAEATTQATTSRERPLFTSRTATLRIGSVTASPSRSADRSDHEGSPPLSKSVLITILVFAAFFACTIIALTWRKLSRRHRKRAAKRARKFISSPLESKQSPLDFTDGGRNSLEKQYQEDESYSYDHRVVEEDDDDPRRMVASYYYQAQDLNYTHSPYYLATPPVAHQTSRSLPVEYEPPERSSGPYPAHALGAGTGSSTRTLYAPQRYY